MGKNLLSVLISWNYVTGSMVIGDRNYMFVVFLCVVYISLEIYVLDVHHNSSSLKVVLAFNHITVCAENVTKKQQWSI